MTQAVQDIGEDAWVLFFRHIENTPGSTVWEYSHLCWLTLSCIRLFSLIKTYIVLFYHSEFKLVFTQFKIYTHYIINILSISPVLPFRLCFMHCPQRVEPTKACCACVYSTVCVCWGRVGGGGGVQTHRLITQHCHGSQRHCTLAASIQATTTTSV